MLYCLAKFGARSGLKSAPKVPRSLVLKFHFQLAITDSFDYSSSIIAS